MDMPAAHEDPDAAWVSIETRANLSDVQRFCSNVERLFRINPHLQIRGWTRSGQDVHRVELRNLSNGREERFMMSAVRRQDNALMLVYENRLKRSTTIQFERCDRGTRVRITDDYSGPSESERRARSAEVDRSLTAWGFALSGYLEHERRMGRFKLWHAWLDRVWLRMSPAARRIALILVAVGIAEIAITIVIASVMWIELRSAI